MTFSAKFSKATLKKIGMRLADEVRASDSAKQQLPDRWGANWRIYRVSSREDAPEILDGMGGYNIPITRSKFDMIVANTCGTILGLSPIVQCIDQTRTGYDTEPIQADLELLMLDAGFADKLKDVVLGSIMTNCAQLSLLPKTELNDQGIPLVTGLVCEDIQAELGVFYPPFKGNVKDAKTYGFRFEELEYVVRDRQQTKEWLPGELYVSTTGPVAGDDSNEDDSDLAPLGGIPYLCEKDQPVKLAWLVSPVHEDGGKGKRYVFTVAVDTSVVLKYEPYAGVDGNGVTTWYTKPCQDFVRFRRSEKKAWTDDSVANGTQDLQRLYSRNVTLCQQGGEMSAFGILVQYGGSDGQEFEYIEPGMIKKMSVAGRMEAIKFPFDASAMPLIMEKIEGLIDTLTGVGRLGSNEALPSGATAHEVQALVATMNQTKDANIDSVSGTIEYMWSLALDYYKMHFGTIKEHYGTALQVQTVDQLDNAKIKFKLTGTSSESTPGQQLQKWSTAMTLAGSQPDVYNIPKMTDYALQDIGIPVSIESLKYSPEERAARLEAKFQAMAGMAPNGQPPQDSTGAPSGTPEQPSVGADRNETPSAPPQGSGGQLAA